MSAPPIVFTCNSAFGVANFRGGVIRALVQRGHRIVVVAPSDAVQEARLRALGAEFEPWAVSGRGASIASEWASVRSLTAVYRRLQPALCFHFTIKAVIYGAIACRRLRVPGISVITGLGYVFLNASWVSRVARLLYRRTLAWSHEIWFLNDDDRDTFQRLDLIGILPTRMLPGEGIDLLHFSAPRLAADGVVAGRTFLMVARLLRDKGVVEFVEAARQVRVARPGTRFVLLGPAGADNPSAISVEQVRTWQDEGVIEYLGVADDVRSAVAQADCVVLPSYREGMPRTLLEAAAMQRPLIATDVPGCRQPVIDGESGLLCKPRDAADLATKMIFIADLPPQALANMGVRGRGLMEERFDERIVIGYYLDALARCIGHRAASAD
jgi:glycosyltransferase involved in cell wall biosynthesis